MKYEELQDKVPTHHQVKGLDLVMVKYGNKVSVLYGRCLHRGALSREAKIALSKGSEMAGEAEQVRRRPY